MYIIVNYALTGVVYYHYAGNDVFHAMGEILYRSIERINFIQYFDTVENEGNRPIYEWHDKYAGRIKKGE